MTFLYLFNPVIRVTPKAVMSIILFIIDTASKLEVLNTHFNNSSDPSRNNQ